MHMTHRITSFIEKIWLGFWLMAVTHHTLYALQTVKFYVSDIRHIWVVQWYEGCSNESLHWCWGIHPIDTNQQIPFTKISLALFWNCCTAVVLMTSSDPILFYYPCFLVGGQAHRSFMVKGVGWMGYSLPSGHGAHHALDSGVTWKCVMCSITPLRIPGCFCLS
jgi:hypothetical protein